MASSSRSAWPREQGPQAGLHAGGARDLQQSWRPSARAAVSDPCGFACTGGSRTMAIRVDRLNGTGMPNQVGVPPVIACSKAQLSQAESMLHLSMHGAQQATLRHVTRRWSSCGVQARHAQPPWDVSQSPCPSSREKKARRLWTCEAGTAQRIELTLQVRLLRQPAQLSKPAVQA